MRNIDKYNVIAFSELAKLHDVPQSCLFHVLQQDEYIKKHCALHRAHLLRTWLCSLVPADSSGKFTDVLYESLRQHLYNGKWRTNNVRFGSDDSLDTRDEVDGKIKLLNTNISEENEDNDTVEFNDAKDEHQ